MMGDQGMFSVHYSLAHSSSPHLSLSPWLLLCTEGVKSSGSHAFTQFLICFWAAEFSTLIEIGTRDPQLRGRGVLLMVLLRGNGIEIEFTLTSCSNILLEEKSSLRVPLIVETSLVYE